VPVHQLAEGLGVPRARPLDQRGIGHTPIRGAARVGGWENVRR
jgi:hypothetical protein